jgi:hybrid cluster-associated redox disulfide protein
MPQEIRKGINPTVETRLYSDITVKDFLDRYPQLLRTFMDLGLLYVGCPTGAFHTVADVAREYRLYQDQLLHPLQHAIEN